MFTLLPVDYVMFPVRVIGHIAGRCRSVRAQSFALSCFVGCEDKF
jgi:hypothetical protein